MGQRSSQLGHTGRATEFILVLLLLIIVSFSRRTAVNYLCPTPKSSNVPALAMRSQVCPLGSRGVHSRSSIADSPPTPCGRVRAASPLSGGTWPFCRLHFPVAPCKLRRTVSLLPQLKQQLPVTVLRGDFLSRPQYAILIFKIHCNVNIKCMSPPVLVGKQGRCRMSMS